MVFYKNIIYSSLLTFLNFIFLINSEKDEELIEDCGYQINPFGGRISLDGQEFINGHKINCIWIINKQNSYKNFSLTKSSYFDNIFLHIDQFHLKGENITLEIREGINSEGKILIKLEGEQSSKQLAQKQLEQGFEIKIENENGFYIRLQGKIENNSGLSIPYSYFYRWPDPPCNSSMDEFYCDNNKCISNILRCNGYDHCGDSSDEMCNFKGETTNIEYDPLWKSAIVTVIFALLALLLLTLLMILIVSRSARNHLIHSLPSNSIQSIQYRQQQQPRRRGRTTETAIALNNNNNNFRLSR
ncbi:hypothetical protein Mgra_00006264 [Meloidogyne graminicola]|uniref:CUB domain-containing protein n=1 Tax=Meloidogyne graminicola TaxID=189291 RepID=A0A8S9ZLK7_9BILA|nr:hypothetical protein Mgra_00006264 [Meloidogyne graminicola]